MGSIEDYVKGAETQVYAVFRILVGLLFMQHGLQKMFGSFTDNAPVKLVSLMGVAGVIELFGGLLIVLGLFTRLAALFGAANMVGAWVVVHIGLGFIPILNGGELAALYFASFLVLLVKGNGIWSMENALMKKEMF